MTYTAAQAAEKLGLTHSQFMTKVYEVFPQQMWPRTTGKTRWEFTEEQLENIRSGTRIPRPVTEDEMYDLIHELERFGRALVSKDLDLKAVLSELEDHGYPTLLSTEEPSYWTVLPRHH